MDDTFHDADHLRGGDRIDDLLADIDEFRLGLTVPFARAASGTIPLVMTPDGTAIPVLDAVDEGRVDLLAAIGDH